MTILATVTDPQGRQVDLTDTQWAHILQGRGAAAPSQEEVLQAIRDPHDVLPGRKSNELWYYKADIGPSRWLRVVVAFQGERGFIVTAFPRRTKP